MQEDIHSCAIGKSCKVEKFHGHFIYLHLFHIFRDQLVQDYMDAKIQKDHEIAERLANQKSSILSVNKKESEIKMKMSELNFNIESIIGYYRVQEQIEKAKSAGYRTKVSENIFHPHGKIPLMMGLVGEVVFKSKSSLVKRPLNNFCVIIVG